MPDKEVTLVNLNPEQWTVYDMTVAITTDSANYIVGKLATMVDGWVADKEQAKNLKDTLKSVVWESHNRNIDALRHGLYSCKQRGTPMMSSYMEQLIKAREDAERGIIEQNL